MALEQEIVDWAAGRPEWQREALRGLAHGEPLGPADYKDIAQRLLAGGPFDGAAFSLHDMPGTGGQRNQVRLVEIREVENVNALVPNQTMTFGVDGLTVIYGDNASGKSGYARLAKRVVRARHQEDVLTNIFVDRGTSSPAADITVEVDGERRTSSWPDSPLPELGQISFFDEACGQAYISTDSEVTYRPSALFVLDGLIRTCDGVRAELERLLAQNTAQARPLPTLPEGTESAAFLAALSVSTTSEQIDAACALSAGADEEIGRLTGEEARLRATDPSQERARLQRLAAKFERVHAHLVKLATELGDPVAVDMREKVEIARDSRSAANIASATSFDREPLPGVGSATWRALWEAARAFSETEAMPGEPFPVSTPGRQCVLCQQDLASEAADRLGRFESFVRDQTQRQADVAERTLANAVAAVRLIQTSPPEIVLTLPDLELHEPEVIAAALSALDAYSTRQAVLLAAVESDTWPDPSIPLPASPVANFAEVAQRFRGQATAIDASRFAEQLGEIVAHRADLEARKMLAPLRVDLQHEVERRQERAMLDAAKRSTDTTAITRKSTELTKAHVTTIVRDRFTRESDRLRLERVTLEDSGGHKGQLRHRPAFVGAVQHPAMPQVLSEGEQTALGLAGFFTEVFLDDSRSAIVLDDPVSSLDHIRREHVATRLAELSKDRQVIVFTHDVSFVADLRRAADHAEVALTERAVVRRGDEPGVCLDTHPWKTKDVKARLGHLQTDLARIKKERRRWDQESYEKETADWAGKLSETWERAVNMEIISKVVDRTTLEVRPKLFRVLSRITEQDDKEFQESYACCSRWARRHDKSPETNYVAPTVEEMDTELSVVRSWFERIKKYSES